MDGLRFLRTFQEETKKIWGGSRSTTGGRASGLGEEGKGDGHNVDGELVDGCAGEREREWELLRGGRSPLLVSPSFRQKPTKSNDSKISTYLLVYFNGRWEGDSKQASHPPSLNILRSPVKST